MNNELQATIRRQLTDHDVEHLQLWFTDIIGELDMIEVSGPPLDDLLESGVLPNDSSHAGYGSSAGRDTVAVPDWSTFKILPPSRGTRRTACVFSTLNSMGFLTLEDLAFM